jgi:hypothetical protein
MRIIFFSISFLFYINIRNEIEIFVRCISFNCNQYYENKTKNKYYFIFFSFSSFIIYEKKEKKYNQKNQILFLLF